MGFGVGGSGWSHRSERPAWPLVAYSFKEPHCESKGFFRIQGLGFGVWGLGFGVWGSGFGVWG